MQDRRLEFIEFRLLWDGRLNRSELVEFFGISTQQASLDIARYTNLAPENLEYDRSEKAYKVSATFEPRLISPDAQSFLNQLSIPDAASPSNSYIGWRPPMEVVKYPARSLRADFLMKVIWAIRDREDLEVSYQSMRRPDLTRRWIRPHAIAFDGSRWHARAWCHEQQHFKDFVLARLQGIHASRPSMIDAAQDSRWHTWATVELAANRSLTPGQRAAIEAEFGMIDGRLLIQTRECLVHYVIRHLPVGANAPTADDVQLLEWINREELMSFVSDEAAKH